MVVYEARKRTALDGKEWWCVFDVTHNRWSTFIFHGKYKRKKDCEYYIREYSDLYK